MVRIRYLSYFARNIGKKSEEIDGIKTLHDLFVVLAKKYPDLQDIFMEENPDLSVIMNNKSLTLPKDRHKNIEGEIVIGPIVTGG